jgi:hypothetical protein
MNLTTHKQENLVDENHTRIYAGFVLLIMFTYLQTQNLVMLYMLLADMVLYSYVSSLLSPLYISSKLITKVLSLEKKLVGVESKKLALHLGLNFLLGAIVLSLLGYETYSLVLVLFIAFWKLFEATKNICFACYLFELLKRKNIILESL